MKAYEYVNRWKRDSGVIENDTTTNIVVGAGTCRRLEQWWKIS